MATSNIKVLSYNVQMRPVLDHPHHNIRAGKIPAEILKKNYDVIVFQEAFSDPERNKLVRGLKSAYPFVSQVVGGGDSLTKWDGGVIIMSKHKIISYAEKIYDDAFGIDRHAKKGVAHVQILKNGFKYHIMGTHVQAGGDSYKQLIRKKQFADIRSLSSRLSPEEPVLITGDMNVNYVPNGREYRDMLSILEASFPNKKLGHPYSSDPRNNPFHDDYPRGKQQHLDYALYSKTNLIPRSSSLTTAIFKTEKYWGDKDGADMKDLSDHYAVEGDFTFNIPPRKDSEKFPGHWRRIKANGHHEAHGPNIEFTINRTFVADNPGGPVLRGYIYQIEIGAATRGKIKVWVKTLNKFMEYNYFFRNNPALNIYFEPQGNKPWQQVPHRMNELVLKSPNLEQTFAFTRFLENWDLPFDDRQ